MNFFMELGLTLAMCGVAYMAVTLWCMHVGLKPMASPPLWLWVLALGAAACDIAGMVTR